MEAQKLFIDIETSAELGWTYQKYDTTILDSFRPWSILSFAYQWNNEPVQYMSIKKPRNIWDFVCHPENDRALAKVLWSLLDRADWVIAHNGDRFDVRKIQSRFLHYHLGPPSPFKTVDTKKIAKKFGDNFSNKLDDLAKDYGIGRKLENGGWSMWLACKNGDQKAWKLEREYNIQDVVVLHKLYNWLLPWVPQLNLNMYVEGTACPKCQSKKLTKRGFLTTKSAKYQRVQCQDCGGWCRSRLNETELRPLIGL